MQAGFTLAAVTVFQTVLMSAYLVLREPGELLQVLRAWQVAAIVGSPGWAPRPVGFTAMTVQNAAYVRTLGQIELVFTFIVSMLFSASGRRCWRFGFFTVIAGIVVLLQT